MVRAHENGIVTDCGCQRRTVREFDCLIKQMIFSAGSSFEEFLRITLRRAQERDRKPEEQGVVSQMLHRIS